VTATTSTGPRRQVRSERTREQILEAALVEFSTHGFEAASTRAIAHRAGVHQPQIHYHFETKDALWRAAVDLLFTRLEGDLSTVVASSSGDAGEPAELLAGIIRRFVRFAAAHPELNRIMVQEATSDSDRLAWIVERHVRARFEGLSALMAAAGAPGLREADPLVLYYSLVGAASLLYVNAPEGRRLTGREPTDDHLIAAHAEALVALFVDGATSRRGATADGAHTLPRTTEETR
jgi:AcrR family transcriptional regulator